jgi:hypothetical protein
MKNNLFIITLYCITTVLIVNGCKNDFLDAKPSTDILQPNTLAEFQNILDIPLLNTGVGLGILAADEYQFSSDATWLASSSVTARNSYIWAKDLYEGTNNPNWFSQYSNIFYANSVLAGLEKIRITTSNSDEWSKIKGAALFIRAYGFYELINNFSPFYDESTAITDLGIPLRLNPSVDVILPRASVKETFEQIFTDLTKATALLDAKIPIARSRPSKVAAHALLARIYLNKRQYDKAELHADTCLLLYKKILDYNTLSKTSNTPFGINHDEQIYVKLAIADPGYNSLNIDTDVSPELISLYEPNDLRLRLFFLKQANGTYDTKTSYYGFGNPPFVGLATDEIYLIKAECLARRSEVGLAMNFLNQLKTKRWDPNATSPAKPYQDIVALDRDDALAKVLLERRKELVWRGTRWDDIRRFNKEGANVTLTRTINGQTYSLPPNDPRYVFPIPDNEISLSGIQQNIR